jgi:hypothetical protein
VFFGTVNLAALGAALTTKLAGVMIFSGFLLWLAVLADWIANVVVCGYYYRALILQRRFAPNDDDFLRMLPGVALAWARDMVGEPARETSPFMLGHLPYTLPSSSLKHQSVVGVWIPAVGGLAEILFGIDLWLYAGWDFFQYGMMQGNTDD